MTATSWLLGCRRAPSGKLYPQPRQPSPHTHSAMHVYADASLLQLTHKPESDEANSTMMSLCLLVCVIAVVGVCGRVQRSFAASLAECHNHLCSASCVDVQ